MMDEDLGCKVTVMVLVCEGYGLLCPTWCRVEGVVLRIEG